MYVRAKQGDGYINSGGGCGVSKYTPFFLWCSCLGQGTKKGVGALNRALAYLDSLLHCMREMGSLRFVWGNCLVEVSVFYFYVFSSGVYYNSKVVRRCFPFRSDVLFSSDRPAVSGVGRLSARRVSDVNNVYFSHMCSLPSSMCNHMKRCSHYCLVIHPTCRTNAAARK